MRPFQREICCCKHINASVVYLIRIFPSFSASRFEDLKGRMNPSSSDQVGSSTTFQTLVESKFMYVLTYCDRA